MFKPISNYFASPVFPNDEEKTSSASNLNLILLMIAFLGIAGILVSNILGIINGNINFLDPVNIAVVFLSITAITLRYFVFRGYVRSSAIIFVGIMLILGLTIIRLQNSINNALSLQIIIPIALATYLLGRYVGLGILIIIGGYLYWLSYQVASGVLGPPTPTTPFNQWLIFFVTAVMIYGVDNLFRNNLVKALRAAKDNESAQIEANKELKELQRNLEQRVEERTSQLGKRAGQLEAIASVARSTASLQNLEELLPVVTRLVSDRFGYYHTGIFLLDETREFALLRATNSEGGKRMLNRQHKLKLDAKSIVGYATSRGEPRIALDVGTDAVFFDNPDLPNTRSEMALPLRVGGRVIGALDVQSTQPNAFTEDDIATLTTLADQIAIAIENARLFSEAREALKESEETFGRYVRKEWSGYAQQAKSNGYLFDGKRTIPLDEKEKQEKPRPLPQTGRLTLEKDTRELVIPIRLRGQTIGFLDVKSKSGNRKWTQDDLTLLEAAAERAALAIENARLVDSAQRRALRERTIGEISTKIGAVSNLEAIMQAAVEELGRRIGGGTEVTLELNTEQQTN